MSGVKLPMEIKRSTRPLEDKAHYKANEYRTMLNYLAFGMFKGLLPEKYLRNLIKYIIIIRLLCQESILREDVFDSKILINEFIEEYENLYTEEAMLSNVHGHLHFPQQVLDIGPLSKTIGYPFENMLKKGRNKFHGTRNYEGQIAYHQSRAKLISTAIRKLAIESSFGDVRNFINKHLFSKPATNVDLLINPKVVSLSLMKIHEINLIENLTSIKEITFSQRAIIKRKEYHARSYDDSFESMNNNTIEFILNNEKNYGSILNFVNFNKKMYCIVKKLKKNNHDSFINSLDSLCLKHIDKFFIMVNLTSDYELVEFKCVSRKCIFFEYKNSNILEKMIMPCSNLEECD